MLNYTVGQLRTFLAVAKSGSVGGAAGALVVSQPAISVALASLQRAFGVALVQRDGRGVRLTDAGRTLAAYGRRMFALAQETEDAVRAASRVTGMPLRLAAVTTVAENVLPQPLRRVCESHPETAVQLDVGNRGQVWDRLEHWEVNVVVAGRPPAGRRFRVVGMRTNEIVLVGQNADTLDAGALAQATWLMREPGSGTRAMSEELFTELGIEPNNQLTIGSNGAIRECVRAGLGIALQSRDAVRRELESGILGEIRAPIPLRSREWNVAVNDDRELPASLQSFVNDLVLALGFTACTG
jgi:DNA-binding transcriptional LysR family regulator